MGEDAPGASSPIFLMVIQADNRLLGLFTG